MNSTERSVSIRNVLDSFGLDTSLQTFQLDKDGNSTIGSNIHGILRSPRAEGTEAILLVAPYVCENGECIF
jgi:glycosylphosphatidylinositol transamidase